MYESETITLDCSTCEAKVNAEVVATQYLWDSDDELPVWCISFVKCPGCNSPLLAKRQQIDTIFDGNSVDCVWGRATRVWPEPSRDPHISIPSIIRVSLDEAYRCHRVGAHTACAVMCGRALEGVCVHFGTEKKTLALGLRELHKNKIIDERLFQWGEELRRHRNLAAHATEQQVSRDDSTDLLEFVSAICDYIFVLSARFDQFMKRQKDVSTETAARMMSLKRTAPRKSS